MIDNFCQIFRISTKLFDKEYKRDKAFGTKDIKEVLMLFSTPAQITYGVETNQLRRKPSQDNVIAYISKSNIRGIIMKRFTLYSLLGILLFVSACSMVPRQIPKPWYRTLRGEQVQKGASLSIIAESDGTPLLGSDDLINQEIVETAKSLLLRRGFVLDEPNPDYVLKIKYITDKESDISIQNTQEYPLYYAGSTSNMNDAFGVLLASALSTSYYISSKTTITTNSYKRYNHLINCEIYNRDNAQLWKYDSRVASKSIDFLEHAHSMLQTAFCTLPSTGKVIPKVPLFREDKLLDYAQLYMENRLFVCPALPSFIRFGGVYRSPDGFIPFGISEPKYLMAYIDLLQSAEYAIPKGSKKNWTNPTQRSLWKKVTLVGQYYVDNENTPINVVITLNGTGAYYLIKSCKTVSSDEYNSYLEKRKDWEEVLKEFFSFDEL